MNSHFSRIDLRHCLARLPIEQGDVVFIHSNLGFFGRPSEVLNGNQLCEMFLDEIMASMGENGTLVVPTFTYSFQRQVIFNPLESVSEMGLFAEWVRSHSDSLRSEDPCYSVAAIGSKASLLTKNIPQNSFGKDSFFERFAGLGGKVLNLNFNAGSTFIHYVERELNVSYRFDKTFTGNIAKNGILEPALSTIWVHYKSDDALKFDSTPFSKLAIEEQVFHIQTLGRGQIGLISAQDTYKLIAETLPTRPWFLTQAESLGIISPLILPE